MTDDTKAQACADAFKPLAEMGKTLNPAAMGPLYEAAKSWLDQYDADQSNEKPEMAYYRGIRAAKFGGNAEMTRSALALAETPTAGEVNVPRYQPAILRDDGHNYAEMVPELDGDYVIFANYAALAAQLAAMREVLAAAKNVDESTFKYPFDYRDVFVIKTEDRRRLGAALARAAALGVK